MRSIRKSDSFESIGYVGAGGIGVWLQTYQDLSRRDRFCAVPLCIPVVIPVSGGRAGSPLPAHFSRSNASQSATGASTQQATATRQVRRHLFLGVILPEFYGIEAGQSAVGDIFRWWVEDVCQGDGALHGTLTAEAERLAPGESGRLALDWNNDNRTILVDQRLTGLVLGQTLPARVS